MIQPYDRRDFNKTKKIPYFYHLEARTISGRQRFMYGIIHLDLYKEDFNVQIRKVFEQKEQEKVERFKILTFNKV